MTNRPGIVQMFAGSALFWYCAIGLTTPASAEEHLRVFAGDRLQTMREKINTLTFKDSDLKFRLVDLQKGFHVVVFKVQVDGGAAASIEVLGVPPRQIEPNTVKTLKPSDEDFLTIKKLLQLPG